MQDLHRGLKLIVGKCINTRTRVILRTSETIYVIMSTILYTRMAACLNNCHR
jgi:hypothetical protein